MDIEGSLKVLSKRNGQHTWFLFNNRVCRPFILRFTDKKYFYLMKIFLEKKPPETILQYFAVNYLEEASSY